MSEKILTKENAPFIFGTVCTIVGILFGIGALDKLSDSKKADVVTNETQQTEVYIEPTETLTSEQAQQIQAEVHSAAEAGEAVAGLQNQLVRADVAAIDGIFNQMDPYFSAQQGVWSDIPSATFTFNTTYDFNSGVIPVSWTGRDDLGNEVAYVFANYNASSNQFTDVEVYRTSYAWNLLNTDDIDYGLFPGMFPSEPDETDPTETEPTEPTQYEYPYQIGDTNPDTGDTISGFVVQDEGDIRPVMSATLEDGTVIYYTKEDDGNYIVCDSNGQPIGNDYFDPYTRELY